ncbi:MAG: hypothetical protein ACRETQ_04760 [Gammaproteobacteria bacterium]
MNMEFPPVAELLPHRGRAVLIDSILENSAGRIRAGAQITGAHPLFVPGCGVPSWAGIELMAQAIAAHAGLEGRRSKLPPRMGMLLGTRRYQMASAWFPEGARLEIVAEREFGESGGVGACACRILCHGQTLATATIIVIEISEANQR